MISATHDTPTFTSSPRRFAAFLNMTLAPHDPRNTESSRMIRRIEKA
jgi:hypothetical protein